VGCVTGSKASACVEQHELGGFGKAFEGVGENGIALGRAIQANECFGEAGEGARIVGRDLDEALVLNQRFLDGAESKQEPSEVRASRPEAGIDAQCLVVVLGSAIGAALAFFEDSEGVMGLRNVGVDAPSALEQLTGAHEVSALHFDDAEVRERVYEAGAVFERHAEASVGRFEVALREGFDPGVVQGEGAWGQGGAGRTADEDDERQDRRKSHDTRSARLPGEFPRNGDVRSGRLKNTIFSTNWSGALQRGSAAEGAGRGGPDGSSCTTSDRVDPIRAMPSEPSREGDTDSEKKSASEPPRESERPKKKRKKPPLPRTEREIDAPDRLTLLLLGIMGFMTIVLWGFAKGACNYHPPRETRRPRPVKLEELARDPKDAALEMQQRLVQYNFDGALELAADSAESDVKKRKAECAGKVAECAEKKKKNARAATVAALLERDMGSATVRATTHTDANGKVANILRLERRGPMWKVTSFAPDDGSFKPSPPTMEQMPPGAMQMMPAPGASGSAMPAPPGLLRAVPNDSTKAATPKPTAAPKPAAPKAAVPAPAGSAK
jgi:hypothetical protein